MSMFDINQYHASSTTSLSSINRSVGPWEERCQSAYELKKAMYTDLQTLCKERGWHTRLFQVEVGCRGFPPQAVWTTLSSLGIVFRQRRAAVKALGQAAERASSWLWLNRDQDNWKLSNEG